MRGIVAAVFVALLTGGCMSGGSRLAPMGWVARHGGLYDGADAARVQRVADRFSAVLPHPARAHLLNAQEPAAWSWPGGEIYLTRGLADLLSDDELAAVVGHELGHMTRAGYASSVAALTGSDAFENIEMAADRRSVELLALTQQPRTAMRSALVRLLDHASLSDSARRQIQARIDRLD